MQADITDLKESRERNRGRLDMLKVLSAIAASGGVGSLLVSLLAFITHR